VVNLKKYTTNNKYNKKLRQYYDSQHRNTVRNDYYDYKYKK